MRLPVKEEINKFILKNFRKKQKVNVPWKTKEDNAHPATREKGKRRSLSNKD